MNLPRLTPSRNYALSALLLLKMITTNANTIKRLAILDSGATSHFLATSAPATNILPTAMPIIARLPNGNPVHSTHTCMLDIPSLPPGAHAAHIIPGLALHLLLSIVTMCNAGCTITFSKIGCTIVYRSMTIICGHNCTRTGLWMIPLAEITTPSTSMPTTSPISIKLMPLPWPPSMPNTFTNYCAYHQLPLSYLPLTKIPSCKPSQDSHLH